MVISAKIPNAEFADGYTLTGRVTILDGVTHDSSLDRGQPALWRDIAGRIRRRLRTRRRTGAVRLHVEGPISGFQPLNAYISRGMRRCALGSPTTCESWSNREAS